ncbi:hypothetical protein NU195Hw_g1841t1 [Hortaea werneckii]
MQPTPYPLSAQPSPLQQLVGKWLVIQPAMMRGPHEHVPAQHQRPAFYREHIRGFEPNTTRYGTEEDELNRYHHGSDKLRAPLRYLSFRAQDALSGLSVEVFILPSHALTGNQGKMRVRQHKETPIEDPPGAPGWL